MREQPVLTRLDLGSFGFSSNALMLFPSSPSLVVPNAPD